MAIMRPPARKIRSEIWKVPNKLHLINCPIFAPEYKNASMKLISFNQIPQTIHCLILNERNYVNSQKYQLLTSQQGTSI